MARGSVDYGGPRRDRGRRVRLALLALGLVVSAVVIGGAELHSWLIHQHEAEADSQKLSADYAIHGAACPSLTAAEFAAQPIRPPKLFKFGGVTFARRFGEVDCAEVAFKDAEGSGGYPVCQFTAGALIVVTTDKGERYFAPGVGRPATIAVPPTGPTCVLATNTHGEFGRIAGE